MREIVVRKQDQLFNIGGIQLTRIQVNDISNSDVHDLLAAAHQSGQRPRCLCDGENGVEMVLRRLQAGRYILARLPGSGQQHNRTCISWVDESDERSRIYRDYRRAIQVDDKKNIDILLRAPLSVRRGEQPQDEVRSQGKQGGHGVRRASTTMLGVEKFLWNTTELNHWSPRMQGKRDWSTVERVIGRVARRVKINNENLSDVLYIPGSCDDKDLPNRNNFEKFMQSNAYRNKGEEHFVLLLGEIEDCLPNGNEIDIKIKNLNDYIFLLKREIFSVLQRKFCKEVRVIREKSATIRDRVIGLMVIGLGANPKTYTVHTLSLMRVTAHWIPVDSRYESFVAEKLVDERRRFIKPIFYGGGVVFPDFLLIDSRMYRIPMEIFGVRGNAKYNRRKQKKKEFYNNSGQIFWCWEIGEGKCDFTLCPPFPPRGKG